jgi:RNA polymerase sigma-70 factor (ECF subfamily)
MESEVSPEELLARIAAGCTDAFSTLYDNFSAALFGITLGILKNHAEAEETLQDLFVSIWEKASRYDSQHGRATTWLTTMTRNRAIDRLRSRQRREKLHESARHETFLHPTAQEAPDSPLIAAERAISVREALKSLPDEMRIALELAYFHSLTQTEIAATLNEPLGTVKARIRRAMERVRLMLTNHPDSQEADEFLI